MFLLKLLLKNAFRHKLRTGLTVLGLVVAICAFGLLRTIVDAWYAGVEGSSSTRLVTRSNISLTFPAAAELRAANPRRRGRARDQLVQLVRRRVHHRAQLLPAVRG
jgi:hypothetical protein